MNGFGPFFPLSPASSVLDTSLNNANPVIHGPFLLFIMPPVWKTERTICVFRTGVPAHVAHVMEQVDQERVAVVGGPAVCRYTVSWSF